MHSRSPRFFLSFILVGLLSSCGSKNPPAPFMGSDLRTKINFFRTQDERAKEARIREGIISEDDAPTRGRLEKRLFQIEKDAVLTDACDTSGKNLRVLLVKAVDGWQKISPDDPESQPGESFAGAADDGMIRVGPLKLKPRVRSVRTTEWKDEKYSWKHANELFLDVKGHPELSGKWKELRKDIISLLNDDTRRRVDQEEYALNRNGVALGAPALTAAKTCNQSEITAGACASLENNASHTKLRNTVPTYGNAVAEWKKASAPARAKAFETAVAYLTFLSTYNDLRPYEGVHVSKSGLQIEVDAGDFSSAKAELADLIEKFWNVNGENLTLRWRKRVKPSDLSFFLFQYVDLPGTPSSVLRTTRTVRLVEESWESTPAHEFGHVLGFRDNYFRTWDASSCEYTYEYLSGDLMSEVSKGVVLPEHWQRLHATYPQ